MALHLEAVGVADCERSYGFPEFEDGEMVQRSLDVLNLTLGRGLRPRCGNRKSKGNRRERLHSGLLGRKMRKEKSSQ